jgi:hypothetical protein
MYICPIFLILPNYKEGAFIEEYENALVLNKMLSEFRNNQN